VTPTGVTRFLFVEQDQCGSQRGTPSLLRIRQAFRIRQAPSVRQGFWIRQAFRIRQAFFGTAMKLIRRKLPDA